MCRETLLDQSLNRCTAPRWFTMASESERYSISSAIAAAFVVLAFHVLQCRSNTIPHTRWANYNTMLVIRTVAARNYRNSAISTISAFLCHQKPSRIQIILFLRTELIVPHICVWILLPVFDPNVLLLSSSVSLVSLQTLPVTAEQTDISFHR